MVYRWLSVCSRYLRWWLLAHAVHMTVCRCTILIVAEAQSRACPEEATFLDYKRHIVLPADGKTQAGLDVHVRSGTTTWATLLRGNKDGNALLMEMLTVPAAHLEM